MKSFVFNIILENDNNYQEGTPVCRANILKLTRFPYRMMFVSFNSNKMGATSGAVTAYPFGAPGFIPG